MGGVAVYMAIYVMYYFLTLIGRIVHQQPDWAWPPLYDFSHPFLSRDSRHQFAPTYVCYM
jgi:hypothetical protein